MRRARRRSSRIWRRTSCTDHSVAGPATVGTRRQPTVITAHGPVDGRMGDLYRSMPPPAVLVAISESQRRLAPDLRWVATVHNAIPVEDFPVGIEREDYLLFLGRINPD